MLANQPKWLWYAGGAMIGVGFLLWMRSRGSAQSGPVVTTVPSTNNQAELANINDSLRGLGDLIARSGGNVNPPPTSVNAGYNKYAGYNFPIAVNPNSNLTAAQQLAVANPDGYTTAQLEAAAAANALDPNAPYIPADWMAQYYINAANDPAAFGLPAK